MIHSDEYKLAHRPYAVRLDTYRTSTYATGKGDFQAGRIEAVWFRRRRGVTVACVGELRGTLMNRKASDVLDWLGMITDGRHGGDCWGRWDGERYWGAQEPEVMAQHLELLRPMLTSYPEIPEGYSGWWRYPTRADWEAMDRA